MPPRRRHRSHISHESQSNASSKAKLADYEESMPILQLPKTTLECFGGKDGFKAFLDFIEAAKRHDEPPLAVFIANGTDMYPGTGLPSVFIANDQETAWQAGQQMMMSAMMQGHGGVTSGEVLAGKQAIPYVDSLLTAAIEILANDLESNVVAQARSLVPQN